ncbi:MAG: acetolactate synthase [Phycisphaerae bacterium]|nr:acetolactate synthase [Phycisphaerae bacterium]
MPPETEPGTERGYAPPSVRQFSVFLDNRVGKLLELVQLFDDAPEVNLRAFSVLDSSDHAVVRLIFDNADAARHLMRRRQFVFSEVDLLVVELTNTFTLTHVCLFLLGAELNIRFAYPVMLPNDERTTIALAVDDNTLAGQILRRKGFRLLGEEDLG